MTRDGNTRRACSSRLDATLSVRPPHVLWALWGRGALFGPALPRAARAAPSLCLLGVPRATCFWQSPLSPTRHVPTSCGTMTLTATTFTARQRCANKLLMVRFRTITASDAPARARHAAFLPGLGAAAPWAGLPRAGPVRGGPRAGNRARGVRGWVGRVPGASAATGARSSCVRSWRQGMEGHGWHACRVLPYLGLHAPPRTTTASASGAASSDDAPLPPSGTLLGSDRALLSRCRPSSDPCGYRCRPSSCGTPPTPCSGLLCDVLLWPPRGAACAARPQLLMMTPPAAAQVHLRRTALLRREPGARRGVWWCLHPSAAAARARVQPGGAHAPARPAEFFMCVEGEGDASMRPQSPRPPLP